MGAGEKGEILEFWTRCLMFDNARAKRQMNAQRRPLDWAADGSLNLKTSHKQCTRGLRQTFSAQNFIKYRLFLRMRPGSRRPTTPCKPLPSIDPAWPPERLSPRLLTPSSTGRQRLDLNRFIASVARFDAPKPNVYKRFDKLR